MKLKIFLSTLILVTSLGTGELAYENRVQMDENYLLQWSVKETDIVFEMQVRTHGYMGFGLSRDGTVYGADIFISWMDDGHIFFYVSFFFCSYWTGMIWLMKICENSQKGVETWKIFKILKQIFLKFKHLNKKNFTLKIDEKFSLKFCASILLSSILSSNPNWVDEAPRRCL